MIIPPSVMIREYYQVREQQTSKSLASLQNFWFHNPSSCHLSPFLAIRQRLPKLSWTPQRPRNSSLFWRIPQSHPPINPLIYTTRRSPLSQNLGDIILWHHLIPIDSLVLRKQCATSCLLSMLFKEYTWEPFLLWFSLISENRNWYSDIEECAYLCKAWRQQSCCWGRRRREGPSLNDSHRLLPLLVH